MLTPFDVENLNRSIAGVGQSFQARRMEEEQKRENIARDLLQQKILENQQERFRADTAHQGRMEDKADKANTLLTRRTELQDKQEILKTLYQLNAGGQLADLDSVNEWLASDEGFGQVGLAIQTPKAKPDPNVGSNALAQALKQADEYRTRAADPSASPEDRKRWTDYATKLEAWVPGSEVFDTITEKTEPGDTPEAPPKTSTSRSYKVRPGEVPRKPVAKVYKTEQEARADGNGSGAEVRLAGVGLVKLK